MLKSKHLIGSRRKTLNSTLVINYMSVDSNLLIVFLQNHQLLLTLTTTIQLRYCHELCEVVLVVCVYVNYVCVYIVTMVARSLLAVYCTVLLVCSIIIEKT